MGKTSKEARRARRDAQRANVEDERQEDGTSAEDVPVFDEQEQRIVQKMQACIPDMSQETAARVMVALMAEEVQHPMRTHEKIVRIFSEAGHRDGRAKKDAVYEFLEADEAPDAESKESGELTWDMGNGEKAPSSQETVLVTKAMRGQKAPRRKAHDEDMGQKVGGHSASQTLGLALSGKARQPKPRKLGSIDELVWSEARNKAVSELTTEMKMDVPVDEYYENMCLVGKTLLADEIQRRTQKIYDYKATKLFQKKLKKHELDELD